MYVLHRNDAVAVLVPMSTKQAIRHMLTRLPAPLDRWAEGSVMSFLALGSPWHRAMRSLYAKIGSPRHLVRQGPFAGMRYVPFLHVSVPSKIYGTYELELREVVDEISRSNADLLVNIGSAEGYYAVGF